MEVESHDRGRTTTPRDAIVQRLVQLGVSQEYLSRFQPGLVDYVQKNRVIVPKIVSCILPSNTIAHPMHMSTKRGPSGGFRGTSMKESFQESLHWLQWIMFEGEPQSFLKDLEEKSSGQRGVCGAVWGKDDLAYRCQTCQHDPTCAICVPCFQNGEHKDHDYSIMYAVGGCCDCGDETAWKKEGFCSKHKGSKQIQPLPDALVNSMGPVLDALFLYWRKKMFSMEHPRQSKEGDHNLMHDNAGNDLTLVIVEMLLIFCNSNESLLSFVSRRMFTCTGLVDVLVRAERFLDEKVVKKLHELLLKFLGEPLFKYEFSKVFVGYYPTIVSEILKGVNDSALDKYPLIGTFSVQIFTVPTLTPRLVREMNLLGIVVGCLWDIFSSCVGEDSRFQTSKWNNLHESSLRLVSDARFIMSHEEVSKYVASERSDVSRMWIKILSIVQGMDPQKRLTGTHAEDENENLHLPFVLSHYLGNVHILLVGGAFSAANSEDMEDLMLGKEKNRTFSDLINSNDSENKTTKILNCDDRHEMCHHPLVPPSVLFLIFECLKSIESWLDFDNVRESGLSLHDDGSSLSSTVTAKKMCRKSFGLTRPFESALRGDGDEIPNSSEQCAGPASSSRARGNSGLIDDSMELDFGDSVALGVFSSEEWPDVVFDVSSQEVSFHIPLHRLLSMLLRKAMRNCFAQSLDRSDLCSLHSFGTHSQFFKEVLGGSHPFCFSAFVMDHPLRLRVFCAQVRAGMWRRNGDAGLLISEGYRSVRWIEEGLESDLFLLQCCAALAPPDSFIRRIQERFGLSNYTLLNMSEDTEYEQVLVQDMLTLIIQIVIERRFCGFSEIENLRRDLTYKLSFGDSTHSQLVKSLPRDLAKNKELQSVMDSVALYSNPSHLKQGKYSLRKESWKELDLYHPRFSSRELQAAEERYARVCGLSSLNAQLPKWSKIFHPLQTVSRIVTCKAVLQIIQAVLYYACFQELSDVSLASDDVLITALHLLALAIDICEKQIHIKIHSSNIEQPPISLSSSNLNMFPILAFACENLDKCANGKSICGEHQSLLSLLVLLRRKYMKQDAHYVETRQCNICSLSEKLLKKISNLSPQCMAKLEQLEPEMASKMSQQYCHSAGKNIDSSSAKKEKMRERQAAILEKMRAQQSKFMESLQATTNSGQEALESQKELGSLDVDEFIEESVPICSFCRDANSQSPMCYLVFIQKSRLATFVEKPPPSWEDVGLLGKEACFHTENLQRHVSTSESSGTTYAIQNVDQEFRIDAEHEIDAFFEFFQERLPDARNMDPVIIFNNVTSQATHSFEMTENDIYNSVKEDVYSAETYPNAVNSEVMESAHFSEGSKRSKDHETTLLEEYAASLSKEASKHVQSSTYSLLRPAKPSSNVSFPDAKFNKFRPKDSEGIHISSCGHAVHQECHDRYLFSLKQRPIRRLGFDGGHIADPDRGELLCPVCRRFVNSILPVVSSAPAKSLGPTISSLRAGRMDKNFSALFRLPRSISLIQSTGKVVAQGRYLKALSRKTNSNITSLEPSIHRLCIMSYSRSHESLTTSGRLSHSLLLWSTLAYSIVSAEIASRRRPSELELRLSSLYEVLYTSNGCMLSSLLLLCQTSRSMNSLEVLLRFRGIQLLAESICLGFSGDVNLSNTGAFSPILEHTDEGDTFPDIQFWRQAADPLLSRDPFSSLMLVLYSLPLPFIASSESFLDLVHLFYVVCILQALLACFSNDDFDISGFGNYPINEVCMSVLVSKLERKHFYTNYMDSSCDPKDMVRRLALPFLRRCALLWKLIEFSKLVPSCETMVMGDVSTSCVMGNHWNNSHGFVVELNNLNELENMFQIPSLETVLKDVVVHALALKWCKHFCDAVQGHKHEFILYSTPAVAFKLMQLPPVYHDLLQRYTKLQCSYCNAFPQQPALCLLCGKLCSPGWKPCCRYSRCLDHAITCGAGVGVFLLIRRTTILLQRNRRQALWPSPYLDAFGEEDIDLLRGKPLYLNEERYQSLMYLVASHSLDHTSEVLRQTMMSPFAVE